MILSARDVSQLKALVAGLPVPGSVTGIREIAGLNNNLADPGWGANGQAFLRLTEASYGAPVYTDVMGVSTMTQRDINPIFAGLDPRVISNTVGVQGVDTPVQSAGANTLFTAFGQYFDHGLTAALKGGSGTLVIGEPGMGRTPGTNNPADLTRATVAGIDANGVPIHLNNTTAFIDQNQAYGANQLVTTFLRETDGQGGVGAKLAGGLPDPSNPQFDLLPTLRQLIHKHWDNDTRFDSAGTTVTFREFYAGLVDDAGVITKDIADRLYKNFMDSGQPLLVDLNPFISPLDHSIGGDGRANENITLAAMHTVWVRNHNQHVDGLVQAGFSDTPEALYQAAKIINETEYQRVIYTDFADVLLGGMRGSGSHGHDQYFADVNPGITHEFAGAAYRFGHSLVGQTVQILDASNQMQSVKLFDAFLNPTNAGEFTASLETLSRFGYVPQPGYMQIGVDSIMAGIIAQPAEEVDAQVVDAIRNDLVRVSADLFSLNVARGRDLGLGTLNQVRQSLLDSRDPYVQDSIKRLGENLSPYTSWEDFQARNALSQSTIDKFRIAYPDLVLGSEQAVADFRLYNPTVELVGGNTVQGVDRLDLWVGAMAEAHVRGGVVGSTFWVIIHEQLDRLQEADRYYYFDRVKDFDFYSQVKDGGFAAIVARTTGLKYDGNVFTVTQVPALLDSQVPTLLDSVAPALEDFMGAAGVKNVDTQADIVFRFSEEIQKGNGTVELRLDSPGGQLVEAFDMASSARVRIVGDTLTIDASLPLLAGERYVVLLPADAITDRSGNLFQGVLDHAFTTRADSVGTSAADVLMGGSGNDRLEGLAGDDLLNGKAGNDTLSGGLGNDTLMGGSGNDTLNGGAGTDTVSYAGTSGSVVVNLSTVSFASGLGKVAAGRSAGAAGVDTLTSIENAIGGDGNDTIVGSAAANVLMGGGGRDVLIGGAGNDTLAGGTGADQLTGGTGADHLTGGAGRDTFVFAPGASGQVNGFDVIADYTKGSGGSGDAIEFSSALRIGGVATAATASQASISQRTGVATFAAGSANTLADALSDIATSFGADGAQRAGEFALFQVGKTGSYWMMVSDGTAGVTGNDVVVQLSNITSVFGIDLSAGVLTITA